MKIKRQKWDIDNIPDQKGRVAIVTGSSSGIGFETARVLANKNVTVIIAVRNLKKGNSAVDKIKTGFKNADVSVMELDLANLESVKSFVANFRKKYSQLDLLINNAGVMIPPFSKTRDGFELQFGTNHLGHFALTLQLLDMIKSTKNSRIVNVSSSAHRYGNINFDDLNWDKRHYKPWKAYGDSKIANLYFTLELQKKLNDDNSGVIVATSHPGWTATDLQRHNRFFKFMNNFFAQNIAMGVLPTLYAAISDDVKGGEFIGPSGWQEIRGYPKKVKSNELSHDEAIASKLWEVSEKLTGVAYK